MESTTTIPLTRLLVKSRNWLTSGPPSLSSSKVDERSIFSPLTPGLLKRYLEVSAKFSRRAMCEEDCVESFALNDTDAEEVHRWWTKRRSL